MEFPKYKEWIGESDRISNVYVQGVREFIKYARRSLQSDNLPCPCNHCDNGRCLHFETIELHLVQWGMVEHYKFWNLHGERDLPYVPEQPPEKITVDVEDDLVDDCFGIHELQQNRQRDCVDDEENEGPGDDVNDEFHIDKEYMRLKAEATRPLYPNCNVGHTSLYAMIGLQNIKSRFGLSGNSVTEILLWVKDLLPKDNTLPTSYPSMKSNLKGLGLKYKSIHACKYDCILYRKEHEKKEKCPVCQEPRYVLKKDRNSRRLKFLKVPQKVLKYFPLGPRLKRLYTVPWISEAMTWHSRAEVGGDLMRHPIDSVVWKTTNVLHPEFSKEARNVRLGLATDGFNPFGNLSTNQSFWPVFLVPYNLPPSLCMRKEFSMLSLLIPGPKAPGNDIDIFLAPLIEELKDLWVEGIQAFDSYNQEKFTLRAMLLWAIHDFPAYGTLSGSNVHGYFGCPICGEDTRSEWLPSSQKICYHTHRRFLPSNHKFRFDKNNFLPSGIEHRLAPKKLSGTQIEMKAMSVEQNLQGKHPKFVRLRRKYKGDPNDPNKMKPWSRRSILFDLPYWKENPLRHNVDIMHMEKNFVEHLVSTCLGGTNSKDGEKAREDLRLMKIKKNLWLKNDQLSGRTMMPDGAYVLTSSERKIFLDTLYELRVPTNFSSNLRRVVNYATHDLKQCKSHDWHVIMQLIPLLFKHCFSQHKELRRAIMQISLCFSLLCEKVINKKHIEAAKVTLVEAACVLEKYFPPSFFDISIHLLVHVCDEALICGPVRYRWMYPIERLIKKLKDYVKNNRYVAGSIAEEYITEEASLFARDYVSSPETWSPNPCRERFVDESDDFADEAALGKGKRVKLTNLQYEQVARYMFDTHPGVEEWREKYIATGRSKRRKGASSSHGDFRLWVSNELLKDGDATSRLARLARGPNFNAQEFGRYRVNGYTFSSYSREEHLVGKQNSGISINALTSCVSSSKDKNPKEAVLTFYGVVEQILVLDYTSFKETVFYCDWVRVGDINACKLDQATNYVMVDLTKMKRKDNINDEPFVCASQNIKQVFYSKYINNGQWSVVLNSPKHLTTKADALEAPREYQSILDDNPNLLSFLVHLGP